MSEKPTIAELEDMIDKHGNNGLEIKPDGSVRVLSDQEKVIALESAVKDLQNSNQNLINQANLYRDKRIEVLGKMDTVIIERDRAQRLCTRYFGLLMGAVRTLKQLTSADGSGHGDIASGLERSIRKAKDEQ